MNGTPPRRWPSSDAVAIVAHVAISSGIAIVFAVFGRPTLAIVALAVALIAAAIVLLHLVRLSREPRR